MKRHSIELEDAVAHVLQEVAVVGHHEQGGSHRGQSCFQPRDHVQVEVVGGLVQDQKIRRLKKHLCQGHTSLLTAAQAANATFKVVKVEFAENFSCARLEVPALVGVHRIVSPLEFIALESLAQRGLVIAHGQDGRAVPDVKGV